MLRNPGIDGLTSFHSKLKYWYISDKKMNVLNNLWEGKKILVCTLFSNSIFMVPANLLSHHGFSNHSCNNK